MSHRVNTTDLDICNSHSLIVPIWLHHKDSPEKKVFVYALLDDLWDACFVKDETRQMLAVSGPDVQ